MSTDTPAALDAQAVAPRTKPSNYPEPFASRMAGREKRQLGDRFGLKNFGVNLTILAPGGESALLHRHTKQDEFVYILEGHPTLVTETEEIPLRPGMCAGFPAGGIAHHLVNRSGTPVHYLEIGDRTPGDGATYPSDDLKASLSPEGTWQFTHKDGRPY
ncbi:MAG: cupin domain-containing protein [Devosia sp.]